MNEDQKIQKFHMNLHRRAKELRDQSTPAEKKLWQSLRGKKMGGFKFRRQHPIGMYLVDFCCPAKKLVIEIDGGIHQKQQGYDQARSQELTDRGYTVIRFQNDDVVNRLGDVLRSIMEKMLE